MIPDHLSSYRWGSRGSEWRSLAHCEGQGKPEAAGEHLASRSGQKQLPLSPQPPPRYRREKNREKEGWAPVFPSYKSG